MQYDHYIGQVWITNTHHRKIRWKTKTHAVFDFISNEAATRLIIRAKEGI